MTYAALPDPNDMPAELSDRIDATDAALAARVALGDADALAPLYARHKATVYRFALLWSSQAAVAADVTQDVFLHLLQRAGDYDAARGPLTPWLLGIARNFVHRRTGADAHFVANDDDIAGDDEGTAPHDGARDSAAAPTPHDALAARRDVERLRAAIATLPPHYRDVLVLVELSERSYAEAAAICGCELNTVRSRLSRARALLVRALDPASGTAAVARG